MGVDLVAVGGLIDGRGGCRRGAGGRGGKQLVACESMN